MAFSSGCGSGRVSLWPPAAVPVDWIGRRVEVRETKDKIEIQLDARRLVTHRRIAEAEHQRILLAEHRPPRGQRASS